MEIVVDSWEIECCAPPPVVGERSSWRVLFVPSVDHRLATEHEWSVLAHDPEPRLSRDGITAAWGGGGDGRPEPGLRRLHGYLSGAAHVVPPDLAPLTGPVRRVRVLSEEFVPEDGRLVRVPGTFRTEEVDRSPRWFATPNPVPVTPEPARSEWVAHTPLRPADRSPEPRWAAVQPGAGRHETGIVIDLEVPG
ncbi:hypothetical protein AFB00_06975 [Pseudonocardia sp. HH130630-07]|nr:hypothetical protein AFB00_06975 [Pseudonocardia sp. HH130630-07]